jgi:ribosomal protein L37AE/L43A
MATKKQRDANANFVKGPKSFTEQRVCAVVSCGEPFNARINTQVQHCVKCRKAHEASVYVPRYNGLHSKVENPDADD